jgi:CubicO group peptidase (beta-lactamase class C family)
MRALITLLLCAAAVVSRPGLADNLAALSNEIDRIRVQHGVSAAAVIVVDTDEVLLEHYSGITDWDSPRTVDRDTYFRLGSVTKVFTGLALLRAEEQGKLSLQQAVAEILARPQSNNPWAEAHPLRVAQLMEHTAGWYDMSSMEFDDNNSTPLSPVEALALRPESRVMHWPPGWHSEYSNSGPGMASYVIEQATGEVFDQYIVEQVFKPLAMDSASLLLSDKIERSLATGYDRDGHSVIPYWHIVYRASGGLNVLPFEMSGFLQMLLNHGRLGGQAVFSKTQIKRLETPKTALAAQTGLEYGYGLGIYSSLYKQHVLFGHGGDADGYLAHFKYSRESGRAYLVVINAFNHAPLRAMQEHLNDYLVADLPAPLMPEIPALDVSVLTRYTGLYHQVAVRFPREGWQKNTLQVRLEHGRLQTSKNGSDWRHLVPVNEQHFRRANEPLATVAFIPVNGDRMVLQLSNGNYIRD